MNFKSDVRTFYAESGVPRNFEKNLDQIIIVVILWEQTWILINIDVSQSTKAHAHGSICLNVNINIEVASQ